MEQENSVSERPPNHERHIAQRTRLSRLAGNLALHFTSGHDVAQTPEYNAEYNEFMWQQYIDSEHDKFENPDYGDHRRC